MRQVSSRDSGIPSDWEQERWNRQRSDSISGSDMGSKVQRKLSNTSCPPSVRGVPHSTSVFDLNNPIQHNHHHGFVPVQQVKDCYIHFKIFYLKVKLKMTETDLSINILMSGKKDASLEEKSSIQ